MCSYFSRKEVTNIRVVLYGLTLQDHLLLPNMQLFTFNKWSEVENALSIYAPDVVVIHENLAEEALSWISLHMPELPVAIVVDDLTKTKSLRYWTSIGATQVWSINNWTSELCQRDEGNALLQPRSDDEVMIDTRIASSHRDAVIIAVAGVYGGLGVTHTALSLAHFLSMHERVAVWESNNKPCFDFLDFSLSGAMMRKVRYDLNKRLTLFKATAPLEMVEFVTRDYRYLIYDLGAIESEEDMALFNAADVPILISSFAPWRQVELLHFCRKYEKIRQDRWRFVFPHCSEVSREIRECLKGRATFALPSHVDTTQLDQRVIEALEAILGMTKPQKKRLWQRG